MNKESLGDNPPDLRAHLAAIELRQKRRHKAALMAFGYAAVAGVVMFIALAPYIHTETEVVVAAAGIAVTGALIGFLIFDLMMRGVDR